MEREFFTTDVGSIERVGAAGTLADKGSQGNTLFSRGAFSAALGIAGASSALLLLARKFGID